MQKKNFFSILLFLFLLTSCNVDKKDGLIIEKNNNISSFIILNEEETSNLFNSNINALVFIGSSTCSSCMIAHQYLTNYIKSTKNIIYWIDYYTYSNFCEENDYIPYQITTLLVLEEGKVKSYVPYSNNNYSSQARINGIVNGYLSCKSIRNINCLTPYIYNSSWESFYLYDKNDLTNIKNELSKLNDSLLFVTKKDSFPLKENLSFYSYISFYSEDDNLEKYLYQNYQIDTNNLLNYTICQNKDALELI